MYQIMLVDDEENILKALERIFRGQTDWEIESYSNVKDALKRAQVTNFDLFLSDYRMPEMNGVEFLSEVKNLQPNSMRLILSGHTDLEALLGAINNAEIYRFVTKPWQDYELISTIKQALAFRDVLVENRHLADQVRAQQKELDKRKQILEQYKNQHPELFSVDWATDGSIILSEDDV
ncbi:MAG: response regulator [Gammaproteobacteria bacterium]|nr:response regulator [Gammaproteobacteria bacterium]